jgi:hypothetical protein
MTRRAGVLVAGILLVAMAGCGDGGGGGDEAAFCDELEALSDQVADGDLASEDGLEDAVDRANALIEVAADGEQSDAVQAVGEELSGADPDDAADTAEVIQDELGDLAEDVCDIDGDDFAVAEDATTTTDGGGTTTTDDGDTTTTEGGGGGDLNAVGAVVDPATAGVEPGFEENVDLCFRGLMVACDDIFFGENGQAAAPDGSVVRAYAGTCGGRIQTFSNDTIRCDENIFAATPFDVADFTDASFEALATACQGSDSVDGDMGACDELFVSTGVGTAEEAYGDTCGGRIDPTVADRVGGSCVEIFGAVAEFG